LKRCEEVEKLQNAFSALDKELIEAHKAFIVARTRFCAVQDAYFEARNALVKAKRKEKKP